MAIPAYYAADGTLTDSEAWVGLGTTTLESSTASITFTSPNDGSSQDWGQFMDIVAICYWAGTQTGAGYEFGYCYVNGDSTTSNYQADHLYGDGANPFATEGTPMAIGYGTVMAVTSPSTISTDIFGCTICHFLDINSGKFKSSVSMNAGDIDLQATGCPRVAITGRTWEKQDPITSLVFRMENGNLRADTRIDLFGVLPRMVA